MWAQFTATGQKSTSLYRILGKLNPKLTGFSYQNPVFQERKRPESWDFEI